MLIHIVDVSGSEGRDPKEDFVTINNELRKFNPELAEREMLVAVINAIWQQMNRLMILESL